MPAMIRSLSSCFDVTRIWRRTERANLEKKPSMRLSQEPCCPSSASRRSRQARRARATPLDPAATPVARPRHTSCLLVQLRDQLNGRIAPLIGLVPPDLISLLERHVTRTDKWLISHSRIVVLRPDLKRGGWLEIYHTPFNPLASLLPF
jgi:hypothetical protein